MITREEEALILKYLFKLSDRKDLDELNDWIAHEKNQAAFKAYIKTHFAISMATNDPELNDAKEVLLKTIRKEKNIFYRKRFSSMIKYAAIALLFLMIGIFTRQDVFKPASAPMIIPREDVITLQLSNGDIEIINEDEASKIIKENGQVIGKQQGKQLVYQNIGPQTGTLTNKLNVPNGRKFNLVLSDGTKVYLNSGSSITYPISFEKDTTRYVSLTGEAYFEVAHDKDRLFMVNTQEVDVRVYGTQFNISNYPEDENAEVALLQGSLSMAKSAASKEIQNELFLEPGYKGSFNKTEKDITREKVNTALYTSWMTGNLVLRNETFENIIRKLERHYNVTIINNNTKLSSERFNATIETNQESIEQVFSYFKKVYNIEYRIVENKIVIN